LRTVDLRLTHGKWTTDHVDTTSPVGAYADNAPFVVIYRLHYDSCAVGSSECSQAGSNPGEVAGFLGRESGSRTSP